MNSINISLPESLRQYMEGQIESGEWANPGEYIRELIRQDRKRRLASLEETLLEGLSSQRHELSPEDLRSRGVVSVLRDKVRRD